MGYTADAPVDDEFLSVWRIVQVLTDMTVIAASPELRAAAHEHLEA
jgi:hypothetical protein